MAEKFLPKRGDPTRLSTLRADVSRKAAEAADHIAEKHTPPGMRSSTCHRCIILHATLEDFRRLLWEEMERSSQ